MAAPWFKLYAKELLADSKILQLSDDEFGKLVKLWAFASQDGSIPAEPGPLAKLLRLPGEKQMVKHLVWVRQFFAPMPDDPTRLYSRRLAEEMAAYDEKIQKLRENGTKGGRPPKPKAKPKGSANGLGEQKQLRTDIEVEVEKEKEGNSSSRNSCPEPLRAPAPLPLSKPVFEFPDCVGRGPQEFHVFEADFEEWRKAYPALDLEQQLWRMRSWLKSHPTQRKTHKGMRAFITGWLGREQDKAPKPAGPAPTKTPQTKAERLDELDRQDRLESLGVAVGGMPMAGSA